MTVGAAAPALDPETSRWLRALGADGAEREAAYARLHARLLRTVYGELRRRGVASHFTAPELEDLAQEAAADALVSIRRRLPDFRGESRFTTWAYKFAIFEVSAKLGRHYRRVQPVSLDAEDWDRLPAGFGFDPARQSEWRELVTALRRAVDTLLTDHQRRVFAAIVLNAVPLDALVQELGSNRNAIYKTLYDARRKLREQLVADGHLTSDE